MRSLITRMKYATHVGSSLSMRLVYLTGKYPYPVHPKHLVSNPLWFKRVLRKNARVLDLGCGNGQITLKSAQYCHWIVGVERNPTNLETAHTEVRKRSIHNVSFVRADLEQQLPFHAQSFDVVLLLDVLEHVEKDAQLLRGIHRILTKRGVVCVAVPNRETRWKREQRKAGLSGYSDKDHKREYTEEEIRGCMEASGFQIQSIEPVTYDTWAAGLIDLLGGISLSLYDRCSVWKRRMVIRYPGETTGWRIIGQKL